MIKRLTTFVPCLLLLLVAGNQMFLCNFDNLSAWKGGGFGMFSTPDAPNNRMVLIYLDDGKQTYRTSCPFELQRSFYKVRTFPNRRRVESFAASLLEFQWIDYGVVAGYVEKQEEPGGKQQGDDDWDSSLTPGNKRNKSINKVRLVGIQAERYSDLPEQTPIDVQKVIVEVWRPDRKLDRFQWKMMKRVSLSKDDIH